MQVAVSSKSALLIVDMQRDFCEDGSLPVRGCSSLIPLINSLIKLFKAGGGKVVASRDWHPSDHISFSTRGGPWPPHCIKNTSGAEFHPGLKLPKDAAVISKATEPDKEAYSAFDGTELHYLLSKWGIKKVFIAGVATDYCVKSSALDALTLGYELYLIKDAVASVTVEGDKKAIKEVLRKGGVITYSSEVVLVEGLENA